MFGTPAFYPGTNYLLSPLTRNFSSSRALRSTFFAKTTALQLPSLPNSYPVIFRHFHPSGALFYALSSWMASHCSATDDLLFSLLCLTDTRFELASSSNDPRVPHITPARARYHQEQVQGSLSLFLRVSRPGTPRRGEEQLRPACLAENYRLP